MLLLFSMSIHRLGAGPGRPGLKGRELNDGNFQNIQCLRWGADCNTLQEAPCLLDLTKKYNDLFLL